MELPAPHDWKPIQNTNTAAYLTDAQVESLEGRAECLQSKSSDSEISKGTWDMGQLESCPWRALLALELVLPLHVGRETDW